MTTTGTAKGRAGFTPWLLVWRTMGYFGGVTGASVMAVAVATAVLVGALLVGDSVRGSLRHLAAARLGDVDQALVAGEPFETSLAPRVQAELIKDGGGEVAPMLVVRGRVAGIGSAPPVSGVQVLAVGGRLDPTKGLGGVVISTELAQALGSGVALPTLTFTVPQLAEGRAGESVLARRGRGDVLGGMHVKVKSVAAAASFAGAFDLAGSQRLPKNAWVGLGELGDRVGQSGRANVLLAMNVPPGADVDAALRRAMGLSDYGLLARKSDDGAHVTLMARGIYLLPGVVTAAEAAARDVGVRGQKLAVGFVSELTCERTGKSAHYMTGAGISALDDGTVLGAGEVALNAWTAEQLGAAVGDAVTMRMYQRGKTGELKEVAGPPMKVGRILEMAGLGADRALVPEFKGMTDVERVADWRPPEGMKIDRDLADEAYWEKYKGSPKVLMALAGRLEEVTGFRVPAGKWREFERKLTERLRPADVGLGFMNVREKQLAAAGGSTDFAGLFVGFSFFLMAGAMVVVAMLFRLSVEQRVRQLGVLAAVGFTPARIRMLMLREGLFVAAVGGAVGLLLALAYTWVMMAGLRTWWGGATGTSELGVHVGWRGVGSMAGGYAAMLAMVALTVAWAVRSVLKVPVAGMLAGRVGAVRMSGRGRWARRGVAVAAVLAALTMMALGRWGRMDEKAAFLLAGALLLLAGLAALRSVVGAGRRGAVRGVVGLARRNAGYRPGRSMLTAGLIALASFTLVTVASMKGTGGKDAGEWPSGTGGYRLMVSCDIPLMGDLNTETGRRVVGVREVKDPLWGRARFVNLRVWRGEDVSCLNMTRPTAPTVVELPAEVAGRLGWAKEMAATWGGVPVAVDAEVSEYILHVPAGGTIGVRDQMGVERKLVVAGLLRPSVFQSDVLMGPDEFGQLFPMQPGFARVLVECSAGDVAALSKLLAEELDEFSVTVERTEDRLAKYQAVANTYLSTFQALGALGLLLGTVGVGVVLVRSVLERKAELALMGALGFGRGKIMRVVFMENAGVMAAGLVIGTVAAVLAVVPAARGMNWPNLAGTFAGILGFGLLVLLVATRVAVRGVRARALRAE